MKDLNVFILFLEILEMFGFRTKNLLYNLVSSSGGKVYLVLYAPKSLYYNMY